MLTLKYYIIVSSLGRHVLVVSQREPAIDYDLFIRPFRREAWYGIAACICVLLGMVVLPYYIRRDYFSTNGFRLIVTTGWLFFVLLEVYYSGTLTMLFTNEAQLTFETVQDVVKAYPSWKLMHQKGSEFQITREIANGKGIEFSQSTWEGINREWGHCTNFRWLPLGHYLRVGH